MIFTSQLNMVIDPGIRPSLYWNCHHQILYAKFDLKIFYLPSYEKMVLHIKHANSDHIKREIGIIDREYTLNNLFSIQQSLFSEQGKTSVQLVEIYSLSRAVFSCNMWRGNKVTIFLSYVYLCLYTLYRTNITYFGISLQLTLNSWL